MKKKQEEKEEYERRSAELMKKAAQRQAQYDFYHDKVRHDFYTTSAISSPFIFATNVADRICTDPFRTTTPTARSGGRRSAQESSSRQVSQLVGQYVVRAVCSGLVWVVDLPCSYVA